jgi:hypothetical protein
MSSMLVAARQVVVLEWTRSSCRSCLLPTCVWTRQEARQRREQQQQEAMRQVATAAGGKEAGGRRGRPPQKARRKEVEGGGGSRSRRPTTESAWVPPVSQPAGAGWEVGGAGGCQLGGCQLVGPGEQQLAGKK